MNSDVFGTDKTKHYILLLVLLVLCSYWIFFNIYRVNIFDTVPHDDYAPYLLYLVGQEGGRLPGAPFAYRVFSVAAALPFYYVLPVYEFTLLKNVSIEYMRAVEALAMVAYISMLISSIFIYLITTKKFHGSASSGLIGSLAMLLVLQLSGYTGVDPIGIMLVCILVFYSRNPTIYGIVVLLSVGFNEKVSLVLSLLMISRLLLNRDKNTFTMAALSVLAFIFYLAMRTYLGVPGNEGHMQVAGFFAIALGNASSILSLKRIVMDVAPVITLVTLYLLAAREYGSNPKQYREYFSISDILGLLGLVSISMGIDNMKLNVGRVSIFCAAFYFPLAAIYISKIICNLDDESLQRKRQYE